MVLMTATGGIPGSFLPSSYPHPTRFLPASYSNKPMKTRRKPRIPNRKVTFGRQTNNVSQGTAFGARPFRGRNNWPRAGHCALRVLRVYPPGGRPFPKRPRSFTTVPKQSQNVPKTFPSSSQAVPKRFPNHPNCSLNGFPNKHMPFSRQIARSEAAFCSRRKSRRKAAPFPRQSRA